MSYGYSDFVDMGGASTVTAASKGITSRPRRPTAPRAKAVPPPAPARPASTRTKTPPGRPRTIDVKPNWTKIMPPLSREEIHAEKVHRRRVLERLTGQKYSPPPPAPANQLSWELRYHALAAQARQRRIVEIARRTRQPAPVIGGPEAALRQADIRRGVSWAQRGPH
jgi:hypothetical protein